MSEKNYFGCFTYARIRPGDGKLLNRFYEDCVMLKDVGELKKGMKISAIAIQYEIFAWVNPEDGGPEIIEPHCIDNSQSFNDEDTIISCLPKQLPK
jgi:hypothetical protein